MKIKKINKRNTCTHNSYSKQVYIYSTQPLYILWLQYYVSIINKINEKHTIQPVRKKEDIVHIVIISILLM